MKIGIISDSHGSALAWETAATKFFKDCDLIIHAGDILYHGPRNPLPEGYDPARLAELINSSLVPIMFARGNCDAEIDSVLINYPVQAPYALLFVKGKSVLVTHGQEFNFDNAPELAGKYNSNLIICGHTHIPWLEEKNGTTFLNPGSCALPKGGAEPTIAIWENNIISILALNTGEIIKQGSL